METTIILVTLCTAVGYLMVTIYDLSKKLTYEIEQRRKLQKQVLELATTFADSLSTIRQALR